MHTDLEALAGRMAAMEEDAFREFADFFGPRLRALFRSRGLSAAEADDLAVTCITDIALKANRYDPSRGGRFAAWVFTLAYRALIDLWRRQPMSEPLPPELALAESLDDPAELVELTDAVREAVAKLPASEQILVRLRDLGGMVSYREIAERLGIQPSAARVRHHRALRRLRSLLEPDPRIQWLLQRGSA